MKTQAERIETAKKTLEGFEKAGRMFWLGVMVKAGEVTKAEAGFLVMNVEGLKA